MYNGGNETDENSYLFAIGIRSFPFGAGLLLGLDAGVAGLENPILWGGGLAGTAAWVFGPFELGVRTVFLFFKTTPTYVFAVMPFLDLAIKIGYVRKD